MIVEVDRWDNGKKSILPIMGVEWYRGDKALAALQMTSIVKPQWWISRNVDEGTHFLLAVFAELTLLWQQEKAEENNVRLP